MVLNSAKNSLPLSTVILLGRGYLVNHANSIELVATRSALASGTDYISIQVVAESIMVIPCK